eukprot:jgi/Ulvmu1/5138/UM021_0155.1
MGLTCRICPSDGDAVRAAADALLSVFPAGQSAHQTALHATEGSLSSHGERKLCCDAALVLLCLQSSANPHSTAVQIYLGDLAADAETGPLGCVVQARLQHTHMTDKRAASARFRTVLAMGMLENAAGLKVTFRDDRSVTFKGHAPALHIQSCGVSCIFLHRFMADIVYFGQTLLARIVPAATADKANRSCKSKARLSQIAMATLINLTNVSMIFPETGWSSDAFVMNSANIRIEPYADGSTLRNHVQASLREKLPASMAQRIMSFKQEETVGCCQDVAFELGSISHQAAQPGTQAVALHRSRPVDNRNCKQLLTAVVKAPKLFWMRVHPRTQLHPAKIQHREFGHGSSIVLSLEMTSSPSITLFWANLQVLASEAHFSQVMRTLFGNLGENGFDLPAQNRIPPLGTFTSAQQTPTRLQLPDDACIAFTTNIELGAATFLTEADSSQEGQEAQCLVQTELTSCKVQHKQTVGGAQKIIVASEHLCILKSPSDKSVSPSSDKYHNISTKFFPIIQARRSKHSLDTARPHHTSTTRPSTVQNPSAAYNEELQLEMQTSGFVLDYVIHAEDGVRGTHCLEVTLRQVDVSWPFMDDYQLIWSTIMAYSRFVQVDSVSPIDVDADNKTWFFVNVLLEDGQIMIVSPESMPLGRSGSFWYPTVLASWNRMRIGYDWGGKKEAALLFDSVAMKVTLASDMKVCALQRGWTLRQNGLDLHTLICPFDATIQWSTCMCLASSENDGWESHEHDGTTPAPTVPPVLKDSFSLKHNAGRMQPTVAKRRQSLGAACSTLRVQLEIGLCNHVKSLMKVVRALPCLTIQASAISEPDSSAHISTGVMPRCNEDCSMCDVYSTILPSAMSAFPSATQASANPVLTGSQCMGEHYAAPFDVQPHGEERADIDEPALVDHSLAAALSMQSGDGMSNSRPCKTSIGAVVPKVYRNLCGPVPLSVQQLAIHAAHADTLYQTPNEAEQTCATKSFAPAHNSSHWCMSSNISESSIRSENKRVGNGDCKLFRVMKASLQGIEAVLIDDSCSNEAIPSLRIALHETHVVWQQQSRSPIHASGSGDCLCIQKTGHLQTTVRCMYFNSRLDVEDFFISDWPIAVKHDALPVEGVTSSSISSAEDLTLRVSPACLDSIMDCAAYFDLFMDDEHSEGGATAKPTCEQHTTDSNSLTHDHRCQITSSLFKLVNRSGLGVACYPQATQSSSISRMNLASSGKAAPLKFSPWQEMVYLPDLARTVAARTVAVQLDSSFIGTIKAIEHVVVDRVGHYAYPLHTHSQPVSQSNKTFQYALIVSVHLEHRTKVVSMQTPYRLSNKCGLALRMKLQTKSHQFRTGVEAAISPQLVLNPVMQLPRNYSGKDGCAALRRNEDCFLPITALAERPYLIRMYVTAASDDRNQILQESECIDLQSQDIHRQQGVYQCSSADGPQYVCLHISSQPVQAMRHDISSRDNTTCDEFSTQLRVYTISFLPPLIIRSALPSSIHMKVSGATVASKWVVVDLGPGDEQEIYSINIREKYIIFRIEAPGSSMWQHVQLRRRHGFSKECQFPGANISFSDHHDSSLDRRILFTVNIDETCGQTVVNVCSPIWVVNRCGVTVNVLLPHTDETASPYNCIDGRVPHSVECDPCLSSSIDASHLTLLGFSGSQSLKVSLCKPNMHDKGSWRRVSVASIGLRGPISCPMHIPQQGDQLEADPATPRLPPVVGVISGAEQDCVTQAWSAETFHDTRARHTAGSRPAKYELNIHVAIGRGAFAASKLITIAPATVCTNASNTTVLVQQCHSGRCLSLEPTQSRPIIWFNPDAKQELSVRPIAKDICWMWSGRFTVSDVANHALRLHAKEDGHYAILPITVMMQGYSMVCTIGAANSAQAPYLIHNACTDHIVHIRQKESMVWPKDKYFFQIMPRSAPLPFAWDDTASGHKLVASIIPSNETMMPGTLRTHEHEFNVDRKLDIQVQARKVGRVAAFRRGLRHRGYNLVKTMADMQTISYLLDRDRDESETGFHATPPLEQGIRVTVQTEGPTHIVTFDDRETSHENGDVLNSLMILHEEAWQVDMALRKFQDNKGILIDIPVHRDTHDHRMSFDADGSDTDWARVPRGHVMRFSRGQAFTHVSRHQISMETAHHSADRVLQGDNSNSGRKWFHQITRASSMALTKQHVLKPRSNTVEPHIIRTPLNMTAAAVAESSMDFSLHGSDDSRAPRAPSIWSKGLDPGLRRRSSARDTVNWLHALPVGHCSPFSPVGESRPQLSTKRVNFTSAKSRPSRPTASSEHSESIVKFSGTLMHHEDRNPPIPGNTWRILQSDAITRSISGAFSETANRMDGSLRVQLLYLRDISMDKNRRWKGKVQVSVHCETLATLSPVQTSQPVRIAWGHGQFDVHKDQATHPASAMSIPSRGFDMIIRKVPTSGVLTLTLLKAAPLGLWAIGKAHLHLEKVQHQACGGHEIEHCLAWQPVRGRCNLEGNIVLHAFWMSTEQERLEMELMTLQAEVHRKRELLAQLKDKYGDDAEPGNEKLGDMVDMDHTEIAVDWRQFGNLTVDVLQASLPSMRPRMGMRFKTKLILVRRQGSKEFQSTSWSSGITPSWNEKLRFERCCRQDVIVFQVFELHRFGADELQGQAFLPLHTLPKRGQPQYKWLDLNDLNPQRDGLMSGLVDIDAGQVKSSSIHIRLEFNEQKETQACWALDVTLRGVGVSVIDCISTRLAQELMYIHMMDVRGRFREHALHDCKTTPCTSELSISVQNLQIDNQLLNASAPVVVCRRQRILNDKRAGILKAAQRDFERQSQGDPLFTLHCIRSLSDHNGPIRDSVIIRNLTIHLEPLEVCLEEAFMDDLRRFALLLPMQQLHQRFSRGVTGSTSEELLNEMLMAVVENTSKGSTISGSHRWFFESFKVDQITIHFTFVPCHDCERRNNSTLLSIALATGLSMSDLDDIRLCVAAFGLESKFASPDQLVSMISAHFVRQVWSSLHKLVGHVQIIGSTIALGSSLVSGAWYIFYQPYFAARSGSRWTEVAQGVLIGTSRAVGEFGSSIFVVLGQLIGVIGTGIRMVSYGRAPLDRSLLRKPRTLTHAIVSGSAIVRASSRKAVRDFVLLPARGWREQGISGAVAGAACGISGLFLPVASVFDFTARTMYGIGAEIEMLGSTGRWRAMVRGPRRNHSQSDNSTSTTESRDGCIWEQLLRQTRPELKAMKVVDWVQNKHGRTLVLGHEYLVYCRARTSSRPLVRWTLKLEHISSIITVGYTVVISYTDTKKLGWMRLDIPAWHMVPCQQEAVVEVLMQKVNRQLDNYFERRYVKHGPAVEGAVAALQSTPMAAPFSMFDNVPAGLQMVALRHDLNYQSNKVSSAAVSSDMPLPKITSRSAPQVETDDSDCGFCMSNRGVVRAPATIWPGKFEHLRDGAREGMRALQRICTKARKAKNHTNPVVPSMAMWKVDASAAVHTIQQYLVEAHSADVATVALLYAHARVDALLNSAQGIPQIAGDSMLSSLELVKVLCDPSVEGLRSPAAAVHRCLAASMACTDFIHHSRSDVQ